MKLAEALQERADLNRQVSQLERRLDDNAVHQEGVAPAEDPEDLMRILASALARLEALTVAINLRNSSVLHNGVTLTALLAKRDCLTTRIRILRGFADQAGQIAHRSSHTEILIRSTVSVKDLRTELDGLSKELRLLENTIQSINWTTDL